MLKGLEVLMEKNKKLAAVFCILLMIFTGTSDALRGVFLPKFRETFELTESKAYMIIMMSYVGNLIFLFVGGYLADRLPRKRFIAGVMLLWMTAMAIYVFTENYIVLLFTIMFSLGASTMLSTTVNLITPALFAAPAFFVNMFNFCQGIGITASQNIGGKFSDSMTSWHIANAIIFCCAAVCLVILFMLKLPDPEPQNGGVIDSYKKVIKNPACKYLVLICGFYYIAEHGLQNSLTSYGSEYLGFTVSKSALFLSIFFGAITVGRLILAQPVEKMGVLKSLLVCGSVASVIYTIGMAMERKGIFLICASGLAFSILYPTIVLLICEFYDKSLAGVATGFIVGISTFFDIAFNAFFGSLVSAIGYRISMFLMPLATILMTAMFFTIYFKFRRGKNSKPAETNAE